LTKKTLFPLTAVDKDERRIRNVIDNQNESPTLLHEVSPLILSTAVKGKVFFVIPIDAERTLVGTTDTAVNVEMERVLPEARDITELLQQLFYFFPYLKQGANLMEAIEVYKQVHVRDIYTGVFARFCIKRIRP